MSAPVGAGRPGARTGSADGATPRALVPGSLCAFGDSALLIGAAGTDAAQSLAGFLRDASLPGVVDVVAGLGSVLVALDTALEAVPDAGHTVEGGPWDAPALAAAGLLPGGLALAEAERRCRTPCGTGGDPGAPPRLIDIPTVFDGADLEAVATLSGLGVAEVVEALVATELRVEVLGFSPGFAYLGGLEGPLGQVPRRDVPRPVVPAGSVALANGYAAVYPQGTPGGWQLVGHTTARLFDADVAPFALLRFGDRVRFVPGEVSGPAAVSGGTDHAGALRPADAAPGGVPGFEVLEGGLLTLLEGAGRHHVAHLGVPVAGPADAVAHALANRLVGNPPGAAALEVTGRGPSLRCLVDLHVAVVGGTAEPEIDGRPARPGTVVPVGAGQTLSVGTTGTSLRAVLAVAGGLVVHSSLGSQSTDVLSWTGPPPLRHGQLLHVGRPRTPLGGHLSAGALVGRPATPRAGGPVRGPWVLRVLEGPHSDWFDADVSGQLARTVFEVGAASDRVGLRLTPSDGAPPLRRRTGELASQPMVTGAVQVPPGGAPVVLGCDHATLGGYPVVATVITADLSVLGRCRPGDRVALQPVGPSEARLARIELQRLLEGAVVGHYPTASGT